MYYTHVGNLPRHLYCYADSSFFRRGRRRWEPVVWFGLVSHPGRVWGCTVMTEEGAVYRALPPSAISVWKPRRGDYVAVRDSQVWDCYGRAFTTLEYDYLKSLQAEVKGRNGRAYGHYLFTIAPFGDGFSDEPEQAKEFHVLSLGAGGVTIQPTDKLLFIDKSFTKEEAAWPNLKPTTRTWSCE